MIDEFRFMVAPVILGQGTPILQGMLGRMYLELSNQMRFDPGNLLLCHRPMKKEAKTAQEA